MREHNFQGTLPWKQLSDSQLSQQLYAIVVPGTNILSQRQENDYAKRLNLDCVGWFSEYRLYHLFNSVILILGTEFCNQRTYIKSIAL